MKLTRRNFIWLSGIGSMSFWTRKTQGSQIPTRRVSSNLSPSSYPSVWIELNLDNNGHGKGIDLKKMKSPFPKIILFLLERKLSL